ncbi:hypothetical protein [Sphingopyxis sp. PET50]|uniref:hypothetical protein n=1 Tax=Sphingopyxis sp. PET50 TaxID=2976533 RepID=UPI0021B064C5|nr:hypothetical protein [Sphingopyxis sp. PET50]
MIGQFRALVPALDLRGDTKKGFAVYNAIFNLLVIAGAQDWVSGAIPQPDELDDHHIVPKSWGTQHLAPGAVDTILNRTPLSEETNRAVVRDRLPNAYLPDLIVRNGRAAVEAIMATHFINPAALDILLRDPFTPEDFDAFIRERQRAITHAVQTLLIGGRADLPADLRALDEAVERIELRLRRLVVAKLDNDRDLWPQHMREKLSGRIAQELKRHPGTHESRYAALDAAIEFADLTELLDAMVAKDLADRFTDVFPHKEGLIAKFGQLGQLRNGIRHSRTVNDVVRLEGEAAVHWFDHALGAAGVP